MARKKKRKIIHVNQHVIRANIGKPAKEHGAPITVRTYNSTHRAHTAVVNGSIIFMYRPDKPLDCGARLWAETTDDVLITNERGHLEHI